MASVSGVNSSNANSIYGNRNVLSGIATGLDTESMIQNAVSGYQTKINGLLKNQTSLTWQQEAFRNITSPMVQFSRKYTSYTSSTNLLSAGFFNKAVNTTTNGANASKVTATGKTNGDVEILGVKQLAAKATYQISAAPLNLGGGQSGAEATIISGIPLNLTVEKKLSNVSGSLMLTYGANRTIDLQFEDLDTYPKAEDFVEAINEKLKKTTVSNSSGATVAASTMVKATLGDDGVITFSDNQGAGNTVTITGATGKIKTTLHIDESAKASSLSTAGETLVDSKGTVGGYLLGKSFSMTVDGKTKTITIPDDPSVISTTQDFLSVLNEAVQNAFGNKICVKTNVNDLEIVGQKGSTISLNTTTSIGEVLGLKEGTATSYLNTSRNLGQLLSLGTATDASGNTVETLGDILGTALKSTGVITHNKNRGTYSDADGNLTDQNGNRLGADGKQLYGYDFEINGTKLTFTRDSTMESVLSGINANAALGLNATFSKVTNDFQLTTQETGSSGRIVINDTVDVDGKTKTNLAARLFGAVNDPNVTAANIVNNQVGYTAGKDARLTMSINGQTLNVYRADNTFDVDGLSVTLKETFGVYSADTVDATGKVLTEGDLQPGTEAVTFTSSADADKIVTAINDMVKDLNEIIKSTYEGYSTLPNYKSNKSRYEPLTDEDKADMSESAIQKYEEKAKRGLLFGDSDLGSMYSKFLSAISPSGTAGAALSKMGITTSYSAGITTLSVDEDQLRSALSNDPESVRDAFTSTSGSKGIMVNVSKVISDYAATTGATKGILVEKAGSPYAALSLLKNGLQTRIDDLGTEVDRWQDKLSNKIDYYTEQFTRLEALTNQLNSQSSMLAGMMGG